MSAGVLRHRITIQRPDYERDPETTDMNIVWSTVWDKVPAAIEPLSAKEFVASQAVQSEVSARITIRYREGVTASMRILHNDRIYNIEGVLPDPDSGRAWLTLPCSEGVNDG
ncbi:MAG TPA: head-tail adaptor protein [Pseudomonas xinjiangensis]|uniref:Head-tail adaptor protein n=1 Tax=Halopseudomonas xinjiangensis TaxID=487184 RepID=A0A7V1BLD2_9GAMM|nr:head-tail adaptor protein [Halopseudomonas xinjiangensis]HEC47156.1 head-tail adaptor protein [Halopseudomonas xinjiangensis]